MIEGLTTYEAEEIYFELDRTLHSGDTFFKSQDVEKYVSRLKKSFQNPIVKIPLTPLLHICCYTDEQLIDEFSAINPNVTFIIEAKEGGV